MTALYDKIAKQYKASKRLPFREYVEWYSYNKLLGDISQKSVLDLACGEGFYTRRIKRKGAGTVVGVDISEEMIRLAKQQEQNHPLGVDYILGDVMALGRIGKFDLVVASYLLNYAQTKEHLLKMFQTIAANLKSGGRFVRNMDSPKAFPDRSKKVRP
jgi:2-polyprenyl-3-methyl-5-hydroxy-6-metoxy-1,4-benzoquinol methylase